MPFFSYPCRCTPWRCRNSFGSGPRLLIASPSIGARQRDGGAYQPVKPYGRSRIVRGNNGVC